MSDLTQSTVIPYDAAVTEGRELLSRAERDLWRLAEIAARVEPVHGDSTLEKWATAVGLKRRTAYLYRKTYLEWQKCTRVHFLPLRVASELNDHPDKERIVLENPDLSARDAQKIMDQLKPKKKSDPKPKPEPKPREALERALAAIDRRKAAGEPVTRATIEKEANVSPIIAAEALAIRKVEDKQAEEKVVFSKSKQKHFDAVLAKALKKQHLEQEAAFQARVSARITEHLTEYGVPNILKEWASALNTLRYRKGVMKYEEYLMIQKCLHPDTIQHLNPPPELLAAFNEAFRIFKGYKLALCSEKELPSNAPPLPTLAELHARRAAYEAAQKAKRDARKAAKAATAH